MKSWFMADSDPQDYELGIDTNVTRNGKHSGFMFAKPVCSLLIVGVLCWAACAIVLIPSSDN